jgi:hypothetical protein
MEKKGLLAETLARSRRREREEREEEEEEEAYLAPLPRIRRIYHRRGIRHGRV